MRRVLAISALSVATLYIYGKPDLAPILTGYLGLLLQGGSLLAIGTFISTTTKNQIIAAFATFAVCLLLWVLDWVSTFETAAWAKVVAYMSVITHFEPFAKGVLDTQGRHLLSLDDFLRAVPDGAIDGIAAVEGLDEDRLAQGATNSLYSIRHWLYIVIVVGALGLANWLANRHNKSVDTTANKRFTLSDQTNKIVERTEAGRQDHVLRQDREFPPRERSAGPI